MENSTDVVTTFRTRTLPVPGRLAGYAKLIDIYGLRTVLPHQLHVVAATNTRLKTVDCVVHPAPRWPGPSGIDHLVFALKNEGVNLLLLKQGLGAIGPARLAEAMARKPTSAYLRRLCFFFEWLGLGTLEPTGVIGGNYVDAVDGRLQYATSVTVNVPRWRVRDNLPGPPAFCPLVSRTARIDRHLDEDLAGRVQETVNAIPADILRRASAFLMLNDSKASFEIERERPSQDRAHRWAAVIGRAGETALSVQVLVDLQRDLIEDDRFVTLGVRQAGGFVGEHTAIGEPRPDHISAPSQDLAVLIDGLVDFERLSSQKGYDPVLAATSLAFGFVYVHPFEDGNGRLHRYLIHHVLARRGFLPDGTVVPVSVAILEDLVGYRATLEAVSRPMLTVIDWRATPKGNIEVVGDVRDFYTTFDATPHAEFLYDKLERAVDVMLPDELRFLSSRDAFHRDIATIVDMPERLVDLLYHMLRQNGGRMSHRMRTKEFQALTEEEATAVEAAFETATTDP